MKARFALSLLAATLAVGCHKAEPEPKIDWVCVARLPGIGPATTRKLYAEALTNQAFRVALAAKLQAFTNEFGYPPKKPDMKPFMRQPHYRRN